MVLSWNAVHLTDDPTPEVGRPGASQKYIYTFYLMFIFTVFHIFNKDNTKFHIDTCYSITYTKRM